MQQPIFVLSPLNRSGTNYLARLLVEAGDFAIPDGINEDYLCVYSDHLRSYAQKTLPHWSKPYRDPSHPMQGQLMQGFGQVLLNVLNTNTPTGKRPMLKCPRSDNASNLFSLFPDAKVIICIRDGRDTVESFVRSFPRFNFKAATRLWIEGCQALQALQQEAEKAGKQHQLLFVNYEAVHQQDPQTLAKLTRFCQLPEQALSPEVVASLPIFGSSTDRGNSQGLTWDPIQKTSQFQPVGRWKQWPWYKRWLFKQMAADTMGAMGYKLHEG